MKKTTNRRYVAVTPLAAIEAGQMPIIWGSGQSPMDAIGDAMDRVPMSAPEEFDALPASDRLADYVERYGADADLDWIDKNDAGVADLLDGVGL